MHNAKRHFPAFKRHEARYPSKPATGQPEPTGAIPVHFMDGRRFVPCRVPGAGKRLNTRLPEKVTCPDCLKLLQRDRAA